MTDKERQALSELPAGPASRVLGVHERTLHAMRKRGAIKATRQTPTGRWRFDVADYMARNPECKAKAA